MDAKEFIQKTVIDNPVVLFMKGTAQFPQCGFSGKAVQSLKGAGAKSLVTVNVLDDDEVRKLTQHFIRLDPPTIREETRGLGGSADGRYRASLTRIAQWCIQRKVKEVTVISHGDSLGSLAAMCNMSLYSIEEFGHIKATYDGTWTYKSNADAGIMPLDNEPW